MPGYGIRMVYDKTTSKGDVGFKQAEPPDQYVSGAERYYMTSELWDALGQPKTILVSVQVYGE